MKADSGEIREAGNIPDKISPLRKSQTHRLFNSSYTIVHKPILTSSREAFDEIARTPVAATFLRRPDSRDNHKGLEARRTMYRCLVSAVKYFRSSNKVQSLHLGC